MVDAERFASAMADCKAYFPLQYDVVAGPKRESLLAIAPVIHALAKLRPTMEFRYDELKSGMSMFLGLHPLTSATRERMAAVEGAKISKVIEDVRAAWHTHGRRSAKQFPQWLHALPHPVARENRPRNVDHGDEPVPPSLLTTPAQPTPAQRTPAAPPVLSVIAKRHLAIFCGLAQMDDVPDTMENIKFSVGSATESDPQRGSPAPLQPPEDRSDAKKPDEQCPMEALRATAAKITAETHGDRPLVEKPTLRKQKGRPIGRV